MAEWTLFDKCSCCPSNLSHCVLTIWNKISLCQNNAKCHIFQLAPFPSKLPHFLQCSLILYLRRQIQVSILYISMQAENRNIFEQKIVCNSCCAKHGYQRQSSNFTHFMRTFLRTCTKLTYTDKHYIYIFCPNICTVQVSSLKMTPRL